MGKGKRAGDKRHVKRGIGCKYTGSDDSDEDYTVGEDEECIESDECSSFAGEESEESLFEYEAEIEDEEEEDKKRKVNRSRGRRCFPVRNVPKKRRTSYKEEDDGDFNDDEDYNDEEFTPDENDLDEEEDDEGITKTKVARPPSRKKPPVKRNKGKKGKSTISKKRMTNNTGKNLPRKKRSRFTEDSDLDIMSSKSSESDYEYTISEEEREQLMEASHFCRNRSHNIRNSSSNVHRKREQPPKKRLKTKVDDVLRKEEGKQVCGICFSEEGNRRKIRGKLDCCSHYFCFTCIFEWSKVESRCPMCKQRFNTITKPLSKSNNIVVVQIPERDQIYQPSEEEILSYLDPYENMICIECHQGGDDAIMLLCDLCDSPSHTFCVGLGREVPEGNWYCEACRPTVVPDSSMSQAQNLSVDNRSNEIDLNEAYVPETPLNRVNNYVSSQVTRSRPFTVSERRRIQHRINILVNNRVTAFVNRNRFEESVPPFDTSREVAFQPPRRTVGYRSQGQNWDLFSLSSQAGQTSTSADVGRPNAGSDAGISMSGQREEVIVSRTSQGDPHSLF